MRTDIIPARIDDKPILQNLMELYLYDFSEIDHAEVNAHGRFGYGHLDHYWTEKGRYPFLVHVDRHLAGFVLVRVREDLTECIAEFFVMRKYRNKGVGQEVARRIFDRFPGKWEVEVMAKNTEAQAFWRKVLAVYTNGNFREEESEFGIIQCFDSTDRMREINRDSGSVQVCSRLGECSGVVVGDVLYFDYDGEKYDKTQRCFVLLEEGIQLMHEPWDWKNRWYVDLIEVRHQTNPEIHLSDRYIDIIIEEDGPTYRIIDLEELGKTIAEGKISLKETQVILEQTQTFLDRYVHGAADFPPIKIRPFMVD